MGAWLIVFKLTGQTPPLATDDGQPQPKPKPKRNQQGKVRLKL
jgi:hypothetical protein